MDTQILGYKFETLILVMATAIGAYGGFPTAPPVFIKLLDNTLFQWLLVFVLCYQGGAGQNITLSLIGTLLLYVLHTYLHSLSKPTPKPDN